MKMIKAFLIAFLLSMLAACATVPQESVDLSTEIGIGLKKQYKSQIDLVNLHFSIKRQILDEAMGKAIKAYFKGLTPVGTIELNRSQLEDVAKDVIRKMTNLYLNVKLTKMRLL